MVLRSLDRPNKRWTAAQRLLQLQPRICCFHRPHQGLLLRAACPLVSSRYARTINCQVSEQSTDKSMPTAKVVEVPWSLLSTPDADLSPYIREAYGEDGLGILTVSGVPEYTKLRSRLLKLISSFTGLPPDVRERYSDVLSTWSFGWSHGKEMLQDGQLDVNKGSFYANPCVDDPVAGEADREQLMAAQPAYFRPNVWPSDVLPEFEAAFKELGQLVVKVGLTLAEHCDRYAVSQTRNLEPGKLVRVLKESRNHKGRALHYFPSQQQGQGEGQGQQGEGPQQGQDDSQQAADQDARKGQSQGQGQGLSSPQAAEAKKAQQQQQQGALSKTGAAASAQQELDHSGTWCGWHTDHGSLTGLTCAMYVEEGPGSTGEGGLVKEVPNPDALSGLYIKNRRGEVVKAPIPSDHIAYQVGEAMQVHSGGALRATPHYVRAAKGPKAAGVARNTFAVFMQPDVTQEMDVPEGVREEDVAVGQWRKGQDFGSFSAATFEAYYGKAS